MSSRRARRRRERARSKRARPVHRLSPLVRLGLALGGAVLIVGGVLLLTAGGPGTAARLGRVAGILILLGAVGIGAAVIGKV
jgi:hypothetical protein